MASASSGPDGPALVGDTVRVHYLTGPVNGAITRACFDEWSRRWIEVDCHGDRRWFLAAEAELISRPPWPPPD